MTLHNSPRERLFALEHFGIKLGLDNITRLVEALKRPDRAFPTIHIAGTNGKGSVTAMVERGLRAAGHVTGRYTSPHLVDIEERVAIGGASIDAATFDEVTASVLEVADDLRRRAVLPHSPTFFEVTTAAAFEIFRRCDATVAVIEVGLGGRYDATNVIEPAITAITSIALDHERHLGRTLAEIAFEKAGIIKPGVPVVIGPMAAAPRGVIDEVARERRAPVISAAPQHQPSGTAVTLALPGAHQQSNAAVAVEVLKLAARHGLGVRDEHIVTALADVEWPARLEWLRLAAGGEVLIDAAHNPAGAEALAKYIADTAGSLPVVLGVMKDKDVDGIIRALAPVASRVITTSVSSPRAMEASALAERTRAIAPAIAVGVEQDPVLAVERCLADNDRAGVAGSIFLVGPVRARLLAQGATPVRYPSKADRFYLT